MNTIRRILGIVWILFAVASIYFLIYAAMININPSGNLDINNPLPWIIIIVIFCPIAAGLALFGYYAMKGEYSK